MLCAVEPSGDALGAALMAALRKCQSDLSFIGCGGSAMTGEGLQSLFPIEPFSVIGPVGALRAAPAAMRAASALAATAVSKKPHAVIFIDGWSFSKIAAKRIKKESPATKLIKYVAPQVWASRSHRAKQAADLFDGLLCLFEFEVPYFEKHRMVVRSVGHSGFQAASESAGAGAAFREAHDISATAPLLAVAPGSRASELRYLAPIFGDTVRRIADQISELRIVVTPAPAVSDAVSSMAATWPGSPLLISGKERFAAYGAANAALGASGTVTTEIAIQGTPLVVGYKVDPVTSFWMHRVATTPYAALINNAAGRELIPEFLQRRCTANRMARALFPLLTDKNAADAQKIAVAPTLSTLTGGGQPAAEQAAAAVLAWAH